MSTRSVVALICLVFVSLGSVPASARKRVVVLPFIGPHDRATRLSLSRALSARGARLVPLPTYRRTAAQLKVELDASAGIEQTCAQLRCDAVLAGRVRRRGRVRYQLTVTVVSARGGDVVGSEQVRARGRRGLYRAAAQLAGPIMRLIGKTQRPAALAPARAAPEEPVGEPTQEAVEVEGAGESEAAAPTRRTPTPPRSAEAPRRAPAVEQRQERAVEARPREQKETRPRSQQEVAREGPRGIFEAYAALGFSTRAYTLSGAPAARSYEPVLFSEFSVGGEFYPLALALDNFAKYIGLTFAYSRHIAVGTELPNDSRLTTCTFDSEVDTSAQELIAGLKLRWPLPWRWRPEVSATVGYGLRDYTLGPNNVLPSLNYQFVRLGLGGRVPLGTPLLAIDVGGDLRPLLRTGQESVDSFGERTGGLGWAVRAGVSGRLKSGVTYFAGFEYIGFSMEFEGLDPDVFPLRECTPDTARREDGAPLSGSESIWRGWVGAGYAL